MTAIGDRVKFMRKELGLSQTEFGSRLGVGLGVIRNIEASITVPSTSQIDLICTIYDVNRKWLTDGEGEMFRTLSRDEQILDWATSLCEVEDSFKRRFVYALSKLDESGWQVIEHFAQVLYEEQLAEDEIKKSEGE